VLKYRNTNSGEVVEMPEPSDIVEAAEKEAAEVAKSGTQAAKAKAELIGDVAANNAIHARHTLERMNESTKWERYDESKAKAKSGSSSSSGSGSSS
jgi:hypothetical protein